MFKSIRNWFYDLVKEEYLLTVWFVDKTVTDVDGNITQAKTKKEFRLQEVKKKSQNHFTGYDMDGNFLEIKTTVPFDYYLQKIH